MDTAVTTNNIKVAERDSPTTDVCQLYTHSQDKTHRTIYIQLIIYTVVYLLHCD